MSNSIKLPTILLSALTALLPMGAATAEVGPPVMQKETILSDSLRFTGDAVDVLPTGETLRKTAFMRGRQFEWVRKLDHGFATEERFGKRLDPAPSLDELTLSELADHLRGVAFFNGHEYIETKPAYDLAETVMMYRELEREGASQEKMSAILPGISPSQGNADWVPHPQKAESQPRLGTDAQKSVLGSTDDRSVQNNMSYPHRTHIVFDNTGGSTIDGSQGSGTLIGPSTAMTVAHVFWDEDNDTWEAAHKWAPGFDSADRDSSPWGDWASCYWVTIPGGYTTFESATFDYAVVDFNVGCNSVKNGVNSDEPGATVGWIGAFVASNSTIESATGYVRGYPGLGNCGNPSASCGVRVWGDVSSSSETDVVTTTIRHGADTSGGQSGSAFYIYDDPSCSGCDYGPYLVGMHRAGSTNDNRARVFDSTVNTFMINYSSDF